MSEHKKEKEKESLVTDVLKKAISLGVGAAFMTEDAIKSVVNEIHLPKDILNGLIQNAKATKEDLINSIREEMKARLAAVDPAHLVEQMLENYDVEVKATLKFKRKKE